MVFKNMSIDGVSYGQNLEDVPAQVLASKEVSNFNMSDERLDAILAEGGQNFDPIIKFLSAIAICHTIVTS
jgi:hypothetical protein